MEMEPSRQPPCGRTEAYKHTMISRVPFPNCRSGVICLAIAGNPENDRPMPPWQEAGGDGVLPGETIAMRCLAFTVVHDA